LYSVELAIESETMLLPSLYVSEHSRINVDSARETTQ